MATYLFTWNPKRWDWADLEEDIETLEEQGFLRESWSTGVTKRIVPGDRAFLMRLGEEPRGIIASGWVVSDVYEEGHWIDETDPDAEYNTALYVDIDWDTILNPARLILPHEWLQQGSTARMNWTPQASGITIPDDIAAELERLWSDFIVPDDDLVFQDDDSVKSVAATSELIVEGAVRQVSVTRYERNARARAICIDVHGTTCAVCDFNFEERYGEIGSGFIEVHHLMPVAEGAGAYVLNPLADLVPVCPNCHAMIHRRRPPFTIEETRAMLVG